MTQGTRLARGVSVALALVAAASASCADAANIVTYSL